MAIKIQTTGLDQFAGGDARLQVMVIGGPGAGKTRYASYWPKTIYADCEGGLASVADRQVPFAAIHDSQEMLEFLDFLVRENRRPWADRRYQTVVVDTLDAFQRKVKDEWLKQNPGAQRFSGFDAWGYLESKMQMLLTRLLNLDMNVIVNVHYKDKTIREGSGENASERQEFMLQLSGDIKDSVFNDFDLVGWMGKYYAVEAGERVEKRGLTFKSTPEKPFLKDRLHITPPWMEIEFSDEDYVKLFAPFAQRLDSIPATEQIEEIESSAITSADVFTPSPGGPVATSGPREAPLNAMDKATLQTLATKEGVAWNKSMLKSELQAAIEQARAVRAAEQPAPAAQGAASAAPTAEAQAAPAEAQMPSAEAQATADGQAAPVAAPEAAAPAAEVAPAPVPEPVVAPAESDASSASPSVEAAPEPAAEPVETPAALEQPAPTPVQPAPAAEPAPVAEAEPVAVPVETVVANTATGPAQVNPSTGEIEVQAVAAVESVMGPTTVVSETVAPALAAPAPAPVAAPAPAPAPAAAPGVVEGKQPGELGSGICSVCGASNQTSEENQDQVKIGRIRYRLELCNKHYQEKRDAK